MKTKSIQQFIEESNKIHSNKYNYDKSTYTTNKTKLVITCPDHGDFLISPSNHLKGHGCKHCIIRHSPISYSKDFEQLARKIHGEKYNYSFSNCKKGQDKVKIICPIHGEFLQIARHHIVCKSGCPKCGSIATYQKQTRSHEDFLKLCVKKHGNKYQYIEEYKHGKKPISIVCPIHGEFRQKPCLHLKGGCPACGVEVRASKRRLTNEEFINQAKEIHGEKYLYNEIEYKNQFKKIKILCKKHGIFMQSPNNHVQCKAGCPKCNQSKGEIKVAEVLKKLGIEFTEQHRFPTCKDKRTLIFDFWIESKSMTIEFNGKQHYELIRKNRKGKNNLEGIQKRDQIKRDWCKENNVTLLEIPHWDFNKIEEILKEIK